MFSVYSLSLFKTEFDFYEVNSDNMAGKTSFDIIANMGNLESKLNLNLAVEFLPFKYRQNPNKNSRKEYSKQSHMYINIYFYVAGLSLS